MSWQKCPVCNGTGSVFPFYPQTTFSYSNICPKCKGELVIDKITGHPPAQNTKIEIKDHT